MARRWCDMELHKLRGMRHNKWAVLGCCIRHRWSTKQVTRDLDRLDALIEKKRKGELK